MVTEGVSTLTNTQCNIQSAWLLKPGGVGVAFVKYLGILDLCLEARFSLCLFGIRIRQLNDHYFAKYQRGAL